MQGRCSLVFIISHTVLKSNKSKLFTPNIGYLLKNGIIILTISENFVICHLPDAQMQGRLTLFFKIVIFLYVSCSFISFHFISFARFSNARGPMLKGNGGLFLIEASAFTLCSKNLEDTVVLYNFK